MKKNITVIYITALLLLFQGCYTVIKQGNIEKSDSELITIKPQYSIIKGELAGVWISKRLLIDYGYQYRRLEINRDGRVIYIPNSERSNSKIYYGNYRVLSDTLIINFEDKPNTEWMKYELNADTLYIYNIKEREGTENNLVNDCYNCRRTWLKIQ